MQTEIITIRDDLVIRRLVLEPGEAMPWHTDSCHRFTVVGVSVSVGVYLVSSEEGQKYPQGNRQADGGVPGSGRIEEVQSI